jgi:hypothetical protein
VTTAAPARRRFLTTAEDGALAFALLHAVDVAEQLEDALGFVEAMLRAQLAAATDFAEARRSGRGGGGGGGAA